MQADIRLKGTRAQGCTHPRKPSRRAETLAPSANRPASDELRLEVHDRLGPGLVNIEVRLQLLEESLAAADPARAQIGSLRQEASLLITELRRLIQDRPPARLEKVGLVGAISSAVGSAERTGLQVSFAVTGTAIEPPDRVAEVVYQAALEGIANVVRHAAATRCRVNLNFAGENVMLTVLDDGMGPRPRPDRNGDLHVGVGMCSLRKSARCLGGEVHLLSRPGGGTSLLVRLPLSGQRQARRPPRIV